MSCLFFFQPMNWRGSKKQKGISDGSKGWANIITIHGYVCTHLSEIRKNVNNSQRISMNQPSKNQVLSSFWVCHRHTIYHFTTNDRFYFVSVSALIHLQSTLNHSSPAICHHDPLGMWVMLLWPSPKRHLPEQQVSCFVLFCFALFLNLKYIVLPSSVTSSSPPFFIAQ